MSESTALDTSSKVYDTAIRNVLFCATLFLVWVTTKPFPSGGEALAVYDEGDLINQICCTTVFLTLGVWVLAHGIGRLKPLITPVGVLTLLWFALSVGISWEPGLSGRRYVLLLMILFMAGAMLQLPRDVRHFALLMGSVSIIIMMLCYFGVIFVPKLSIHQVQDILEPEHAGSWRGLFAHKNEAGGMMVVFVFVGIFVTREASRGLGICLIVMSLVFLAFTFSKTPMFCLPLTLMLSFLLYRLPRALGFAMVFGVLLTINLLTIGSVYFDFIQDFLSSFMPDPSFTGRSDIWKFALGQLADHPLTGYGYATFWGTPRVVFGLSELGTWANAATDAHNGFLNVALTTGIVGLAFAMIWLIVSPLRDFFRRDRARRSEPVCQFFVNIWLFGLLTTCFESVPFTGVGPVWFIFIMSVFGLRYSATRQLQIVASKQRSRYPLAVALAPLMSRT